MPLSIRDLFNRIDMEKTQFMLVNDAMIEVAKANKSRPGFLKFAVQDQVVQSFMRIGPQDAGLFIMVDKQEWSRVLQELRVEGII